MRLKVIGHDYVNTGGGCMVSVFPCYCEEENRSYYIMVNEEGYSLSTVDWINAEDLDYEEKMTIASGDWSELTPDSTTMLTILQHCYLEYVKQDFKRFGGSFIFPSRALLTADLLKTLLPDELYRVVIDPEIQIRSDGNKLFVD